MSDEQERQEQGGPPPPEADANTFSWGTNERGDLLIDNVIVERNVHVPDGGLPSAASPPSPEPDEMAAIRAERDELRANYDAAEPYLRIAHDPIMREILNERIARGEIEPALPPPPNANDIREYKLLKAEDPDFPVIQEIMTEWAWTSLPEHEREILNNNHAAFLREYARIKAEAAGRLPKARPPALPSAYPNVSLDRRAIELSLKSKEVSRARVEPPGNLPDYPASDDGQRAAAQEYGKAKERFRQARLGGTPTEISDAETAMVEKFFAAREAPPKRGGVSGY